ncbi:hypothetical protein GVAV_001262 [Gurleya vavrai]
MFFSFYKFIFFQYNQFAYSLIDFGEFNDIRAKENIAGKEKKIDNICNNSENSSFRSFKIKNIVESHLYVSKNARDCIFLQYLYLIWSEEINENELKKIKMEIYLLIFLNMLLIDTYNEINSHLLDKKTNPSFDLNLSLFCDFFEYVPKKIFIVLLSYDYYILSFSEKLFTKDKPLVSYLIKKAMLNAEKNLIFIVKLFKKENILEFPDDLVQT